jgi:hypothetical protein
MWTNMTIPRKQLSIAHKFFKQSRIYHILDKSQRIKITKSQSILSDHNAIKLETSNKRQLEYSHMFENSKHTLNNPFWSKNKSWLMLEIAFKQAVIGKATEALALYIPKCNAGNN